MDSRLRRREQNRLQNGGLARISPPLRNFVPVPVLPDQPPVWFFLPRVRFSRIVKGMEVHFSPETEKKLKDLAQQSGRGTDDLVEDPMIGYFDELFQIRETLDRRYDKMESGKVEGIDGEEAYQRLMAKTQARLGDAAPDPW